MIRSAHIPPHHARASGVAKHHVLEVAVTSVEARGVRPRQEVPAGVGLAAVGARRRLVEREPSVEPG